MNVAARPAGRKRTPKAHVPAVPLVPLVQDSSCWPEFLADTDRADLHVEIIEHAQYLLVPVLTVYELAKKLAREAGDDVAAVALSPMPRGKVVISVKLPLALEAVVNGLHSGHPFKGLPGARYFAEP